MDVKPYNFAVKFSIFSHSLTHSLGFLVLMKFWECENQKKMNTDAIAEINGIQRKGEKNTIKILIRIAKNWNIRL